VTATRVNIMKLHASVVPLTGDWAQAPHAAAGDRDRSARPRSYDARFAPQFRRDAERRRHDRRDMASALLPLCPRV